MTAKTLLLRLKTSGAAVAVTSVTAAKTADVTTKSPSLLGCTSVTSVTSEKDDTAKNCIEEACARLSLPADLVQRQFDGWRYSKADLAEMAGWSTTTIEAHARLLLWEASERTKPAPHREAGADDRAHHLRAGQ